MLRKISIKIIKSFKMQKQIHVNTPLKTIKKPIIKRIVNMQVNLLVI